MEKLAQRSSQVDGPQVVTHGGSEAGLLVPMDEGQRLNAPARPTLKQLLLSDQARAELAVPSRGQARRDTNPASQMTGMHLLDMEAAEPTAGVQSVPHLSCGIGAPDA